jgi:hypothetical protein
MKSALDVILRSCGSEYFKVNGENEYFDRRSTFKSVTEGCLLRNAVRSAVSDEIRKMRRFGSSREAIELWRALLLSTSLSDVIRETFED